MRLRQIVPVALVLGLTVAGFLGARQFGQRDARRDADRRAEVVAAEVRGRLEQGVTLADSLRRFVVSVNRVTEDRFQTEASGWLSPAGFPAAAWVEQVPASGRAAYERRIGRPIVTYDQHGGLERAGSRASYLPATLVSSVPPMAVPGLDLGGEPGVAAALGRAGKLHDAATPLATLRDGSKGLFLIQFAPRLVGGVVQPGFLVVFVPDLSLRAAASNSDTAALQLATGGASAKVRGGAPAARTAFTDAGQRFEVAVPRGPVAVAAVALQWIMLAGGLVLAALVGALGVNAARRARAQKELDRIFTLSPDLIAVADFEGRFTRINPAVQKVLGYTEEEFLARPYLDLVHPDDRERTRAEAAAIGEGKTTHSFENRYLGKDGSYRVLDWTSTPVRAERLMYGIARDVTARRRTEAELERLAGEQAALRRVATLIARGVPPAEVFAAVADEVGRLLDAQATTIGRLEPDGTMVIVAAAGTAGEVMAAGSRVELESHMALAQVARTGRAARVDDYSHAPNAVTERAKRLGIRCTVAVPITVEGRLWGSIGAATARDAFPPDAEQRMAEFTELAGTAIANAQSRSELTASRARVVAASDQTRRQIERDLHDGAQQRLIQVALNLKLARDAVETEPEAVPALLREALDHVEQAMVDLRELVQGILPPILTHGGLRPAVRALARRMPVPVQTDVEVGRFPPAVEATAYFVVAEALTNVAKHSCASVATVDARVDDTTLQIQVRDDGVGGARADGSGLVGLADRVAAVDGRLRIESPADGGTVVAANIPLPA